MFGPTRRFSVTGKTGQISSVRTHSQQAAVAKSSANKETSMFGAFGLGSLGGNSSMNVQMSGPMATVGMLSYLVPQQEDMLRQYYRDIYYYDPVCGAAIDMLSSFPFSDFSLTGVDNDKLEKYQESLARLNIRSLMPDISTTYLVDGQFISSLIFNKTEKIFVDLVIYPVDNCQIEQLPFYSADPKIVVKNTDAMVRFMNSSDPQADVIRRLLPANIQQVYKSKAFQLDGMTTLYMARRPLPGDEPASFLKRVLPIYLLEKTLYRGTLVEAMKRQRSMLHVQMGDDTHEFTPEEMAETVNQFQLADLDPLGAVIGTRNNVQATELRQGGDFWKSTDVIDVLTPYKLRAMGISEAFLSGDSNYSNVETALSVFMENTDAYRSFLTYETFTNKIFPIVAIYNNYYKPGKEQRIRSKEHLKYQASNYQDLEIPTVHWHKRLSAKEDDNVMDTLEKLEEKGLPIPLRMWAAAGKVDLNAYYRDLQEDKEVRDKIAKFTKGMPNTGGGDDEVELSSVLRRLNRPIERQNMLERDYGSASEIAGETKTGKRKFILNQRKASKELNQMIMKAVTALNDQHVRKSALSKVQKRYGRVPNIIGGGVRG